jgi:hypothetical protein
MPVLPLERLRHILDEGQYLIAKKQALTMYRLYNCGAVFRPYA